MLSAFWSIYLFCASILLKFVSSSEVLGCGGYVKSDVEIDFSQVGIKLLTQQGNFKYKTECAPNDGYFFIPLYDKGDYILKVSPPSGWSFDPEEVILKVDGESDACSNGQDINFHFKGFAVFGKVVSIGSGAGPAGVTVTLKQLGKTILKTTTSDGGDYIFTPLASGNYKLIASHPSWSFLVDSVDVSVTDQNGDAGNALIISGYQLTGSVAVNGKSSMKIHLILLSDNKIVHKLGCLQGAPEGFENHLNKNILCHTTSSKGGSYSFSNISSGRYTVVPYLPSKHGSYIITPSHADVAVEHDDAHVQESFKVIGCSLNGKVLSSGDGSNKSGLKGSTVTLDEDFSALTNADGEFIFHNVKFGKRTIKVKADDLEFDNVHFNLQYDKSTIPPITPVRFKTCFSVNLDSTNDISLPWTISINEDSGKQHQVDTDRDGNCCLYLPSGKYTSSVALTSEMEEFGIRFAPKEQAFEVKDKPISNLSFSQFLGEIHGTIICLESCPILAVSLRPTKGNMGSSRTTTANQGKFLFRDVLPGDYLITVDKEEWCWKEKTISLSLNAKKSQCKFEQVGFRLALNASHKVTLSYVTHLKSSGTIEVAQGTSRQCVSSPGKYIFTPISCHKFGPSPLLWDTSSPQLLSLTATHHQVTGIIKSDEDGSFKISVKAEGAQETLLGPLLPSQDNKNVYEFEYMAKENEVITLIPSSSSNLFQYSPSSHSFVMPKDCLIDAVTFEAERALFLKGYVKPPLKGVTISVEGGENIETFSTNADGLFIAGPLDKFREYIVKAEKVGYVIKPPLHKLDTKTQQSTDVIKLNFKAYKLAEIIVKVSEEDETPLKGVLISMSGGKNYKQNSLTESDGIINFQSLMPSEYFLRPMMKEYTFSPASKMVQVEDGGTVQINITAERVAYSIFGQTVSLSGEPEGDVVVEAVGTDEACAHLQEEAVADSQGQFRIRGLIPQCNYKIRLMEGEGINEHVTRALPKETPLWMDQADHVGKKLTVIRPFLQMDIAIFVETDPKFLSTLSAELYRDEMPDEPVHTVNVGSHPFFMLPPMMADKKSYTLQLVSTLSQSQYRYKIPSLPFIANSSFKRFAVPFEPIIKSTEAEINPGTVFSLFFFIFLAVVALNYRKLQPLLDRSMEMYVSSKAAKPMQPLPADTLHIEPINIRKKVKSRKT